MSEPTAHRPSVKSAAVPERLALLHTLAFTALRLSVSQFDAFSTRLAGTLAARCAQDDGSGDAELFRHAVAHLNQHRTAFHRLLGDCLQQELLQAVQATGEHAASGLESGAMDLTLSTFEAMERKVTVDNLSQALDAVHAEALAVLNMRIAFWLRAEEIGTAHNPFRSEVFLKAASEAWAKFDPNGASHHLVLKQMRPDVFLRLDAVLAALNQEFVIRNVLPDAEQVYRSRKSSPDTVPPPSSRDRLHKWLAPEGTLNMIATRAIAVVEKTLAHLSAEAFIPAYAGSLLVRLQPALQKAVLTDKDFFFSDRHPARRLIDAFIRAGLGCDAERGSDDPLYQSMERACSRIGLASDLAMLNEAADELDALIAQEDRQLDDRLRQMVAESIVLENLEQARQLAEQDVTTRIEPGDVAGFIEVFLQAQWARVLAYAYDVRDSRPEVLPQVQTAMDDLIRSVKPKSRTEERRELLDRLPTLLSTLNTWLDVVKWEGEERAAFFSALAERHAASMRATAEMKPRDQLELRMNAVQKASEHQLTRRARQQQEEAMAEFMRLIDELAPGSWLEFVRNNGGKLNCRLLWISPGGSRFIFAGRQGQVLFALDDVALAQAMRADRVCVIAAERMFERALAAAVRELGLG